MILCKKTILIVFISTILPSLLLAQGIHEAAEKGDLAKVKALLAKNPELVYDHSGAENRVPLHCAIRGKHSDVARFLIEQGADVNARDVNGASVLNYASYWGLTDIVRLLIEKGAEVINDITPRGITPLHWAASAGHTQIVKILVAHGAEVRADRAMGMTPLHLAVNSGQLEAARFLLENGADINARDQRRGATPLHLACLRGNGKALEWLLKEGADVKLNMKDGRSAFRIAVESGDMDVVDLLLPVVDDLSERDNDYGMTPLHRAAIEGYVDVTERLLEKGVDTNTKDKRGMTSLFYAAKYGHRRVAELLKRKGGTTNEIEENFDTSPLLQKSLKNGEAFVWYLGHSGWAVKTRSRLLIFDYYEYGKIPDNPLLANGRINPSEIDDLDVTVFVSHGHRDHFDEVILKWDSTLSHIQYVFGWKAFEHDRFLSMDGERELKDMNGIEIVRLASELENESAFLVKVDGLIIYHGGDYYFREGGNDKGDMAFLAGKYGRVDMAFIECGFRHICDHTIEKLRPRVMFPMHARNNEIAYRTYGEEVSPIFPKTKFAYAENRGDRFLYKEGKILKE